jgi:hypothetical protein
VSLESFIPVSGASTVSLVVAEDAQPDTLQRMFEDLFADQSVGVEAMSVAEDDGQVMLVRDGETVATSPLRELQDAILLVNSDLYSTGSVGLEDLTVPDVLAELTEVPFTLRGYPESDKEKLLLVVISRYVEQRAWRAGTGTHRASFQRLSRIDDERGTRRVYEKLAATDLDVHVYGVPDWDPADALGVTAHGGRSADYRHSWFVVHRPDGDGDPAALVAYEAEPGRWRGVWTRDSQRVADIDEYIIAEL